MLKAIKYLLICATVTVTTAVFAANSTVTVPIYFTAAKGTGKSAGMVTIEQTDYGLLFSLNVHGLTPGIHEFHIDQNPSCDNYAKVAGGHFDPLNTGKHLGPYNKESHLGDLPDFYVSQDGKVPLPILAPRLMNLADINNRSLVISQGDEHKHQKEVRVVCGIITQNSDMMSSN